MVVDLLGRRQDHRHGFGVERLDLGIGLCAHGRNLPARIGPV
jgi:hypothetical protein